MCSNLSGPEQLRDDHGMRACLVGMSLPLGRTASLNSISVDYIGSRNIMNQIAPRFGRSTTIEVDGSQQLLR
jgi:hypothetical protein